MNYKSNTQKLLFTLVVGISCVMLSHVNALAQKSELTLAQVLTGLQSKSGGFSLAEKNDFITKDIIARGVTFRVSSEIESELKRAGASPKLIAAARSKETVANKPKRALPPGAKAIFDKLWIDYNVIENGLKGMRVHSKFALKNLKDEPLILTVRVQKEDGDPLLTKNVKYRNNSGQFATFKKIRAAYQSTVFKDVSVFLPYSEFAVRPGDHSLKVDADLIFPDGNLLKHFTLHPFKFTKPVGKNASNRKIPPPADAAFKVEKMWIDYDIFRNGKKGLLVHIRATVEQLKGYNIQFAAVVERKNGDQILGKTMRSVTGSLTAYYDVVPKYDSTSFNNVEMFIPYEEFTVQKGIHNLRIHVDIIYPGTKFNLHGSYHPFRFRRRR